MFVLKTMEQLVTDMITWVRARTTKITDFSEGSKNRTLIEAVAMVVEELYQQVWQALKNMIEETLYIVFEFPALPAKKATGVCTLSRSAAATQDYVIPVGTVVATEATEYVEEIRFVTTSTVTLATGATSVAVPVQADSVGVQGNVEAGKITKFITKPAGVESVTNTYKFVDGRDAETAVERKQRFRDYMASRARGTIGSLEYSAETVDGVVAASAMESPNVNVLVYNGTSYSDISLYANDPYENPVDLLPSSEAINNAVYFGALSKFKFLFIKFSTLGVGSAGVWEYFNGTTWVALTATDGTSGLTASGVLKFTPPSDWKDCKVSSAWSFWIRFRVTAASYTVTPKVGHIFVSPPPGYVELYVQSGDTEADATLLSSVSTAVEAYRGAGIKVNVMSCTKKLLGFVCSIKVNKVDYDAVAIQTEAKQTIVNYLNTFTMGDNFFQNQLATKVMAIQGGAAILSCSLNIDDVLISAGEVVRPDVDNISVTVVN